MTDYDGQLDPGEQAYYDRLGSVDRPPGMIISITFDQRYAVFEPYYTCCHMERDFLPTNEIIAQYKAGRQLGIDLATVALKAQEEL